MRVLNQGASLSFTQLWKTANLDLAVSRGRSVSGRYGMTLLVRLRPWAESYLSTAHGSGPRLRVMCWRGFTKMGWTLDRLAES